MPSYLVLGNWTEQGIRNMKDSPSRKDAARKAIEAAGGSMVFFYMTMGQYDLAALFELPDDDTASRVLLTLGTLGNIRTTTLKAFTEDEFASIIGSLP
jgi:uncharacterized protein with GYD domain